MCNPKAAAAEPFLGQLGVDVRKDEPAGGLQGRSTGIRPSGEAPAAISRTAGGPQEQPKGAGAKVSLNDLMQVRSQCYPWRLFVRNSQGPEHALAAQVEITGGWLHIEKEHSLLGGQKKRYCRLVGVLAPTAVPPPPPSPNETTKSILKRAHSGAVREGLKRVTLYMLRSEASSLSSCHVRWSLLPRMLVYLHGCNVA